MMSRKRGAMDPRTLLTLAVAFGFTYAAWLTSIVFCSANGMRPLLVASALFFLQNLPGAGACNKVSRKH